MAERLLDVVKAASMLGRTEHAIRRLVERGRLPYKKDGRRLLFVESELRAYIAAMPGGTRETPHAQSPAADARILTLRLTRQPEGGFVVTSPELPELLTEGDTLTEALQHVPDAVQAVIELYGALSKMLPQALGGKPIVPGFASAREARRAPL